MGNFQSFPQKKKVKKKAQKAVEHSMVRQATCVGDSIASRSLWYIQKSSEYRMSKRLRTDMEGWTRSGTKSELVKCRD